MKKLFLTLLLVTAVAAGNMFAQTANTDGTNAPEKKKLVMQAGSRGDVKTKIAASDEQKQMRRQKLEEKKKADAADETKKEKVKDHKDQIIQKAGGKAEAKQMLRKRQMQRKEDKKDE